MDSSRGRRRAGLVLETGESEPPRWSDSASLSSVTNVFDRAGFDPGRIQELWFEVHDRVRPANQGERGDDVVQEAFLAILERPPRETSTLRAWLTVVARNISIRQLQRDRSRERREREAAESRADRWAADEDGTADGGVVVRALERLPDPYRTALCLRYLEGLEIDEVARRTGCTPSTVRSHIKRGLDRMRLMLVPGPQRQRAARGALFAPGLWNWRSRLRRNWGLPAAACMASAIVLAVFLRGDDGPQRTKATELATVLVSEDSGVLLPAQRPTRLAAAPLAPESNAGAPAGEWDFELEGRVLDAFGQPVEDVPVLAAPLEGLGRVVAHSDAQGHYRIARIDGREWVWADDGSHAPSSKHEIATVDPDRGLTLSLGAEPNTLVFVLDAEGRPVPGADILLLGEKNFTRAAQIGSQGTLESAPPVRRLRTEPDGSFRMGLVAGQRADLLVQPEGLAPHVHRVRFGEVPPTFDIQLPSPAALAGVLLDPSGLPVPGALLRLEFGPPIPPLEVWTDAAGAFCFQPVPPGAYELVLGGAPRSDLASLRVTGQLDEGERREERVQLSPEFTLQGLVTAGGHPAGHQLVQVQRLNGGWPSDAREGRTDARGRYAFPSCSPDSSHAVRVIDPGGRIVDSRRVESVREEVPELRADVALELARVSGRIESRDAAQRPVYAELFNPRFGNDWTSRVDPETGEFAFQDVLPGDYDLRVWTTPGGVQSFQAVQDLSPREDRRLDTLVLERTGTLLVRVQRTPSTATAEIDVAISVPSIGSRTPLTRRWLARGPGRDEFQVELSPGKYSYWIVGDDQIRELRTALVKSGQTKADVVDLPEAVEVFFDLRAPQALPTNVQFRLRVEAERVHVLHFARTPGTQVFHGFLPVGATRIDAAGAGLRGTWVAGDTPVAAGDVLRIDLEKAVER